MNLFATTAAVLAPRKRAFSWRGGAVARFLASAAALALCAAPASAGTLTYDANTTAPANDGAGVWNTTSTNWYDGTNDVLWSNGLADTAIFGVGGAGGAVTVGAVNVGTIQFNPTVTTGYTLNGGTITLGTGITTTTATGTPGSTINSVITGTNGLAYSGASGSGVGVTLGGANTYTGITTLSTGGRITLGNNTALGTSAGATASTLGTDYTQINTGTGVSFTGQAAIAEAFIINGTGNASGALRFSNPSTLNSLIQLGSDSLIAGAFSANNVINGNIDLSNHVLSFSNVSGTINGVVSSTGGGGSLSLGANVVPLNLTNTANSFAGTLTIGGGTLGLGANGVLGTSTLVFNSGTIQSTDTTARTVSNNIGTFTGNATFGQTATQTGTLAFTSTTASNLNAAARTFTTNVNTAFANAFTGTGSSGITKAGAATLTLIGASTYTGATTISAGTLQLGSGGTTGALSTTGAITDNSNLTINRSNTATQGTDFSTAAITGTGSFTQAGTGTTVFTAANSYSGGTTISAGTLQLGNGGTIGALSTTGAIVDNGNLIVKRSNAVTQGTDFSGAAITGSGGLTQAGTGTTTLTASNSYTGTTTVSAGTLALNAAAADGTGPLAVIGTLTTGVTGAVGGGAVTLTNGTIQNTLLASGATANDVQTSSNLSLGAGNSVATLDFGAGNTGVKFVFTLADASTFNGILNIINYTGNPFNPATQEAAAGGGLDQLFFAPGVEQQLANVFFINPSGNTGTYQGRLLSSGEVVAPEPSQWAALLIGALGLGWLALKARRRSLIAA